MGTLLVDLLPFVVGLAVTPAAIATGILYLGSQRPVPNAAAFAGAFAVVYGLLGVAMLVVSTASAEPLISPRTKAVVSICVGLLLLGLGVLTLARGRPQVDHPNRLLAAIDTAQPKQAFGLGLLLAALNPNIPILFGGLATIAAAGVAPGAEIAGVVLLVIGAELGPAGPILWYVVRPHLAAQGLSRLKKWLAVHEHALNVAVLVVFGTLFTLSGITVL